MRRFLKWLFKREYEKLEEEFDNNILYILSHNKIQREKGDMALKCLDILKYKLEYKDSIKYWEKGDIPTRFEDDGWQLTKL